MVRTATLAALARLCTTKLAIPKHVFDQQDQIRPALSSHLLVRLNYFGNPLYFKMLDGHLEE